MRQQATGGSKIERVSLGEFGKLLGERKEGRVVQMELDARLRRLAPGGVLALDFSGVEMMTYSYADEAIATIYSRMAAREYPDRFLVLASGDASEWLLENLEVALERREVAALVLPEAEIAALVARNGDRQTEALDWRVAGELQQHLVETLNVVMEKSRATVRDVCKSLSLDSVTACNNRMNKLHQLHLVRRTADVVPEGGKLWAYSAIV